MGDIKFKITKIDKPLFFLKIGNIIIVNYDENRVYSEDKKQYIPLDLALQAGVDGEQVRTVELEAELEELERLDNTWLMGRFKEVL